MTQTTMETTKLRTLDLVYIALMAVLMAVCAWISVPAPVPFTMQTFAVFTALFLLGGRRGTLAVLVYLLMGAVGLPVFHGFTGGIGILAGVTGGYLIGFLATALIEWGICALAGEKPRVQAAAMVLGLLACYAFGTAWFMVVYARASGPIGLLAALGSCVFPFVVPDLVKLGLALALSRALKKHLR